jgi:LuxR family maltose regulon positive regulatory protein
LAALIEPYPLLAALLGSAECHAQLGDREAAADDIARAEQRVSTAGDIGDHFEGLLMEARLAYAAERPIAHAVSIEPLTDRELAVLRLLATTQLSQAEIADTLFVSRNTVKSHAKAIYRKLHVSSRGRAAERAGQLGLLSRVLTPTG